MVDMAMEGRTKRSEIGSEEALVGGLMVQFGRRECRVVRILLAIDQTDYQCSIDKVQFEPSRAETPVERRLKLSQENLGIT